MSRGVDDRSAVRLSKMLSRCLRHEPSMVGLVLQAGGWVEVDELLRGFAERGILISRDELEEVVVRNDKRRFAFDADRGRIRASQGHSVEVDLGLDLSPPPTRLFHGTVARHLDAILREGLLPMRRLHVHLSRDTRTARAVASRRGPPIVLAVDSARMSRDGRAFWVSENGVWLTDHVAAQYLTLTS